MRDARFHVNEFRGFEKFCEGRLVWEMGGITSRICGICPTSHLITSAKAGDDILAIQIPEAAEKLRRLITLAQWIQSHALSFFHLSSPDFVLGLESDPIKRNIFGLIEHDPEFARRGIRLRKFGQEIIEVLGGRKIHTPWAVAGGVREAVRSREAGSPARLDSRGEGHGVVGARDGQAHPRRIRQGHPELRELSIAVHRAGGARRVARILRRRPSCDGRRRQHRRRPAGSQGIPDMAR